MTHILNYCDLPHIESLCEGKENFQSQKFVNCKQFHAVAYFSSTFRHTVTQILNRLIGELIIFGFVLQQYARRSGKSDLPLRL